MAIKRLRFSMILPLAAVAICLASASPAMSQDDWRNLLDAELTAWETWIGVPHQSVEGLPAGTFQSADVTKGTPLGLNNDPKQVFSTILSKTETSEAESHQSESTVTGSANVSPAKDTEAEVVLHVSGEIYGGLTTKESFENYHLQMQMRWGDKKWEPRLQRKRDSGVLYHCQGDHGAFWKVWKSCLECQVQESDFGDLFCLSGPRVKVRASTKNDRLMFDPAAKDFIERTGLPAWPEPDHPVGTWNTIDIYVVGDSAIHVVNDVVVLALKDAVDGSGERLDKGQIQIQSEAAECFYKQVRIRPITAFPETIRDAANL